MAAAEAKRATLELRVRAVIEERAKMERELEVLRTALAEGQTSMSSAQADLKALQATVRGFVGFECPCCWRLLCAEWS